MICKNGFWHPSKVPICCPFLCTLSLCINSGTCMADPQDKNKSYHCVCASDWMGRQCEFQKVNKIKLKREIRQLISYMGGVCELNEYVTGPVWGEYTEYEWFVICLSQKEGAYYLYTVSEDV